MHKQSNIKYLTNQSSSCHWNHIFLLRERFFNIVISREFTPHDLDYNMHHMPLSTEELHQSEKNFISTHMAKMALSISKCDLVMVHRPGQPKARITADMPSRCKNHEDRAKLDSLTEKTRGCVWRLCTDTTLELSKPVPTGTVQQTSL